MLSAAALVFAMAFPVDASSGVPVDSHYDALEKCDPLCERISRANKRLDYPVPPMAYPAAIGVCVAFGCLVWFALGIVTKERTDT